MEVQKLKLKLERLLENNRKAFKEFGSLLDAEKQAPWKRPSRTPSATWRADNLARMQESLEELSTASRALSEVILYDPKAMGGREHKVMTPSGDYYEILGVAKNAGQDEIKAAYRKAALKHHPDRNPGDKEAEEAFKKASEAYSVLGDPQRRARYDRFGTAGGHAGRRAACPGTRRSSPTSPTCSAASSGSATSSGAGAGAVPEPSGARTSATTCA